MSTEAQITFTPEALEVLSAVEELVAHAREWAQIIWPEYLRVDITSVQGQQEYAHMTDRITTMEKSWHRGLVDLLLAARSGDVRITSDGRYNLRFDTASGRTGKLVYQPLYYAGKPAPIGTWALSTSDQSTARAQ